MHKLITASTLIALTGCASVTGSKFQPVMVQTVYNDAPVTGAGCTLTNAVGKWKVKAPESVKVQKSISDMLVECKTREGLTGQSAVPSKANRANWGNALLGGPVGVLVDYQTGAGYDYPSIITVILNTTLDAVVLEPVVKVAPAVIAPPPDPLVQPVVQPQPIVQTQQAAQPVQAAPIPAAPPAPPLITAPLEAFVPQDDVGKAPPPAPIPRAPVSRPRRASSYWE